MSLYVNPAHGSRFGHPMKKHITHPAMHFSIGSFGPTRSNPSRSYRRLALFPPITARSIDLAFHGSCFTALNACVSSAAPIPPPRASGSTAIHSTWDAPGFGSGATERSSSVRICPCVVHTTAPITLPSARRTATAAVRSLLGSASNGLANCRADSSHAGQHPKRNRLLLRRTKSFQTARAPSRVASLRGSTDTPSSALEASRCMVG
mmetsp:Transcript_13523/g.59099  ORF Transcript_13523/g.59099 Transcript_13523/m.59099 type:complete len:207 (-) Transcript_13523:33-653(-)